MTKSPVRSAVDLAALLVFGVAGSLPAFAEGRLNGLWSLDPAWCGNDPAATDYVPMSVGLPVLLTHDSECRITSLGPLGMQRSAWRAALLCRSGTGGWDATTTILALARYYGATVDHLIRIDFNDTNVKLFRPCP